MNQVLANQAFEHIDLVEELADQRCQRLLMQKALIQGLDLLPLLAWV